MKNEKASDQKENLEKFYKLLKSAPSSDELKKVFSQITSLDTAKMQGGEKSQKTAKKMLQVHTSPTALNVYKRLVDNLTIEEFTSAFTDPENIKAIKLSNKEMEVLAGGASGFKCWAMGAASVMASAGSFGATLGAGCVLSSLGCAKYIQDKGGF